jgi:hypothetical protein
LLGRETMMHRLTIAATCACLLAGPADAASLTFSGFLNDPGNGALRGSDVMPSPPSFTDDWEIANNVAVHAFNLPVAGLVSFDSQGFAAGGADPYFTLFAGSDDSATVAGSNYGQPVAGDFLLTFALPAGDYQVAMGVFANMSFAENYGTGTLGEGFTRLGGPDSLGSSYYKLVVTTEAVPTPEPAALLLLAFGLTSLLLVPRRANAGRGL